MNQAEGWARPEDVADGLIYRHRYLVLMPAAAEKNKRTAQERGKCYENYHQ
jgi:hypothetical protein